MKNKYQGLKRLGTGGHAPVYVGLHRELGVKRALKGFGPLEEARQKALREAVLQARIEHPHILRVFDLECDDSDGSCYLVMEYAPLGDLRGLLQKGPLAPARALDIGTQVALGLEAAHRKGVCHLDLKPENILFTRPDQAKIADFGLARRRGEPALDEIIRGTPCYMAPEQLAGSPGPASDLWALGAVLLEMLTGKPCFAGGSLDELLAGNKPLQPDAARLLAGDGREARPELVSLLNRLLAPRPEERPASAGEAAGILRLLAAGERPDARQETLELARRCEKCQRPIPLSRRLCPLCAQRAELGEPGPKHLSVQPPKKEPRATPGWRGIGLGATMALLLGLGVWAWQGGEALRSPQAPPNPMAAPQANALAALPKGVSILGAAAKAGAEPKAPGPLLAAAKASPGPTEALPTAPANAKHQVKTPGGEAIKKALYQSAARAGAGSLGKAVGDELERSPQSLGARRNLALLLMQKGDYPKAAALLRGILREKPNDREAQSTLEMIGLLSAKR